MTVYESCLQACQVNACPPARDPSSPSCWLSHQLKSCGACTLCFRGAVQEGGGGGVWLGGEEGSAMGHETAD